MKMFKFKCLKFLLPRGNFGSLRSGFVGQKYNNFITIYNMQIFFHVRSMIK